MLSNNSSHPLDDGIALEQSPVEPAHPDAVHAPPAAVVECAAAKSKAGVLWLVQAADKVPMISEAAEATPGASRGNDCGMWPPDRP